MLYFLRAIFTILILMKKIEYIFFLFQNIVILKLYRAQFQALNAMKSIFIFFIFAVIISDGFGLSLDPGMS